MHAKKNGPDREKNTVRLKIIQGTQNEQTDKDRKWEAVTKG